MRILASRYHRHRFPAEIISHCVWLYFREPSPVPSRREEVQSEVFRATRSFLSDEDLLFVEL